MFSTPPVDRTSHVPSLVNALVSEVSAGFMELPACELGRGIDTALQVVGESLEFDRCVVGLFTPDRQHLELCHSWAHSSWAALWHEWSQPDVAPLPPELVRVNRTESLALPPAYYDGQSVRVEVAQVPTGTALHAYAQRAGLRSLVLAPMLNAGQNFGTLLLHEFSDRCLSDDSLRQLTLLGQLFASVISRFEAEQARALAFEELQLIKSRIERERDYLREEVRSQQPAGAGAILGSSPAMRAVLGAINAVAATQAAVLIRGESGVGKELIARALHDQSPRRDGPLVKVNCASIPRELFESEFFGHARGAFSGALKDRVGRFELADRGTLFLDEVGDIPIDLQAKLLRVLQEGEYERVGEDRTRRVNVRVLSATNRPLEEDIAAGRFRRDLYYRLSTFPIVVPLLRERGEDVLRLARHFLAQCARSAGRPELTLDADDAQQLLSYPWPGNVRELQHVIERAVILSSGPRLRLDRALPELLPSVQLPSLPALPAGRTSPPRQAVPVLPQPMSPQPMSMIELKRLERDNLLAALQSTHWRISGSGGASELLGLKPSTLRDRMRALGIARGR